MIIIGVSGLIAAGKTTFSNSLLELGFPIFNADKIVHDALTTGEVLRDIEQGIPEAVVRGKVDRRRLSDLAFNNKKILSLLELCLHPIVREKMYDFIKHHFYIGSKVVILDIPLLYESNIYHICDYTILVKCSLFAQRYRYLKRKGGSVCKLQKILSIQQKNIFKEKKADFIFDTTLSKVRNFVIIKRIIKEILSYEGNSFRYRDYRFKSRRWRSGY